jgi:DNA-binding beta-propeller fold protein YncE
MKISASVTRAAACAFAAILAGCSASQVQPLAGTDAAGLRIDRSGAVRSPGAMQPDRAQPWMVRTDGRSGCAYDEVLPPCGLLYVSEYTNDDVLVIQHDKLVGTLTGFDGPDGVCSDRTGDVWIVNNRGATIVEYTHGATKPAKTLEDPGEYPLGCAVNPITGSVVVTNVYTTGSGPGSIAVYHHATGKPLILSDPDIYYVYFCGFDPAGNLYIDGFNTSQQFQFAELPRNKYKFKTLTLDTTVYWPGNIQWDGKHIDVGDQRYQNSEASAIYRTTGAGGHVVGTTVLSGAQDVVGYWIPATNVIGPDANLDDVGLYRYPLGGKPTVRVPRIKDPYGATISFVR